MKQKSNSVSQDSDPRVALTLRQIDSAFLALMRRRVYSGIRVSDITKKAGVGRATFYAHYPSKHALLRAQLRRIVFLLIKDQPEVTCVFDCAPLFAHVSQAQFVF